MQSVTSIFSDEPREVNLSWCYIILSSGHFTHSYNLRTNYKHKKIA